MPTNLAIDDQLLNEALQVGRQPSKRATVNLALREFVERRKRLQAIEGFGTIDFDPKYHYKLLRKRR